MNLPEKFKIVDDDKKVINNTALTQNDYDGLTDIEHFLVKPDTYVGSCHVNKTEGWLYDLDNNKLNDGEHSIPDALSRIFIEILSNATDAIANMMINKVKDIKPIEVTMDKKTISIKNYSYDYPIKIEMKEGKNMYLPQFIFGVPRTSSNYDQNKIRFGCGTNGFGAKLTNVYSTEFYIEICDSIKLYKQYFRNNMYTVEPPVIEDAIGQESYVLVRYNVDFTRFLNSKNKQAYYEYPDEAFSLFAGYCACMSLGIKSPIIFNGKIIDCSDINKCANVAFEINENKIYMEHQMLVAPKGKTKKDIKMFPEVELLIFDTPNNGKHLSIINGIVTKDGGVHVEHVYDLLTKLIKTKIDTKGVKITRNHVKEHISIIINCRLKDPKFSSQSKHYLNSPCPTIIIKDNTINEIKKWNVLSYLEALVDIKQDNKMSKTDGIKRQHIKLKNGAVDANNAGTKDSQKCVCLIIEGLSAKSYATKLVSMIKNGTDIYGIFPLKGKIINVRNVIKYGAKDEEGNNNGITKLINNAEFVEIKKMLGLKENTDYTLEENFNTLRYGSIQAMVDADDDGKHILGLLYDMFEVLYPSLLKRQYIKFYRTAIITATNKKEMIKFYSQNDYEIWKTKNDEKKYEIKYFKGLASNTDSEIKNDSKNPKIIITEYDNEASKSLELAFDKKKANERKIWLDEWDPQKSKNIESDSTMTISNFINNEFIKFSIYNIERSIPKISDGLKIVQRKILWTLLSAKNGYNKIKELKTAQLAAASAEYTHYHHGEASVCATINGMTQEFVGSNNMAYFHPKGQFGTRNSGGKDAGSPRYTFVLPNWWLEYVFKKEDVPILELDESDGYKVEPKTFLPILPMALINGSCGIATGYSTFIPCYNPLKITNWLKNKLNGKLSKKFLPWFRGFKGNVRLGNNKSNKLRIIDDNFDTEIVEEPEENNNNTNQSLVTEGKFEVVRNKIYIKELPIGTWTDDYIQLCKDWYKEKIITDHKIISKPSNEVEIELENFKSPTLEKLNLVTSFGMNNFILLNEQNKPIKYNDYEHILEEFYKFRLPYYEKRRQYYINELKKEIPKLENKILFIKLIISNKIDIKDKKDIIYQKMNEHNLPKELLAKTTISNCTLEEITELENELKIVLDKLGDYEKTSPEFMWLNDINIFEKEYKKRDWDNYTDLSE